MKFFNIFSISRTAVAFALLGALTAAAQTASPRFLYSIDNNRGKVYGYRVNPATGAITPNGQNPQWAHH